MRGLTCLCFAIALCLSSVGSAQNAGGSTEARDAFRRGESAYSAGNYEQAIREWATAYKLDPRPRIQYNLSQAYERLADLEHAMVALRAFLDSGDPDDPMYSDANARLASLQQRVALTGVVVRGGGDSGTILVDDKDWGRTPRPDKIPVSPGSHTLTVRWLGRPDFNTNLIVPAGQVVEVVLPDASRGAGPVAGVPAAPQAASDGGSLASPRVQKTKWLFMGLGGGAAALGVGLLTYGVVRGGDVVDCGAKNYCPNPSDSDAAKAQSLVGYLAGGLLLAGGATLIVLGALRGDDQQHASAHCGVGFASASCRVRF